MINVVHMDSLERENEREKRTGSRVLLEKN